jgi:hypothetical protein
MFGTISIEGVLVGNAAGIGLRWCEQNSSTRVDAIRLAHQNRHWSLLDFTQAYLVPFIFAWF